MICMTHPLTAALLASLLLPSAAFSAETTTDRLKSSHAALTNCTKSITPYSMPTSGSVESQLAPLIKSATFTGKSIMRGDLYDFSATTKAYYQGASTATQDCKSAYLNADQAIAKAKTVPTMAWVISQNAAAGTGMDVTVERLQATITAVNQCNQAVQTLGVTYQKAQTTPIVSALIGLFPG